MDINSVFHVNGQFVHALLTCVQYTNGHAEVEVAINNELIAYQNAPPPNYSTWGKINDANVFGVKTRSGKYLSVLLVSEQL